MLSWKLHDEHEPQSPSASNAMRYLRATSLIISGGAGWLALAARGVRTRADTAQRNVRRLARMIDEAPAQLMVVRVDGRIEGSARLAAWLGFERLREGIEVDLI